MIDLDEGMIYRDGHRVIYVLTIEEFNAVIDREIGALKHETNLLNRRLRRRESREKQAMRLETELAATAKERDKLAARVHELENRPIPTAREVKSRIRGNGRYDRYAYLCGLHGIARQNKRWSSHLAELERTLDREKVAA